MPVGRPKGSMNMHTQDLNARFNAAFGNDIEFERLIERTKDIIHNGNAKESAAMLRYVFDRLLGKIPDVINHNISNMPTVEDILGGDINE